MESLGSGLVQGFLAGVCAVGAPLVAPACFALEGVFGGIAWALGAAVLAAPGRQLLVRSTCSASSLMAVRCACIQPQCSISHAFPVAVAICFRCMQQHAALGV